MDFGFNQEQELLRATARKFLESECTSEFVRARMAEPAGVTDAFWAKLAEQGWLGLIYPEEYGGAGLGFVDLTVLMEEMGRAVMPGPFFSTVLLGGLTIPRPARRPRRRSGSARSARARPRPRWPSPSPTRAGTPPPSP
jgi:alkylation response protein AidB-like acyl-CoA dehydrogenase